MISARPITDRFRIFFFSFILSFVFEYLSLSFFRFTYTRTQVHKHTHKCSSRALSANIFITIFCDQKINSIMCYTLIKLRLSNDYDYVLHLRRFCRPRKRYMYIYIYVLRGLLGLLACCGGSRRILCTFPLSFSIFSFFFHQFSI